MCGRYCNARTAPQIATAIGAVDTVEEWRPSWNIRATDRAPVALARAPHRLGLMRWGWRPDWADRVLLNARDDKLRGSRLWRPALARRRCLVPATAWWEWRCDPDGKRPYAHRAAGDAPLWFAGLWTRAGDAGRFVIVTTAASAGIAHVHDRMPVVLDDAGRDRWLDPATPIDDLLAVCAPAPAAAIVCHPVQPFGIDDDGADLLLPTA